MRYTSAYNKAVEIIENRVLEPDSFDKVLKKKGASRDDGVITVPYMGKPCHYDVKTKDFIETDLKESKKILILHYLITGTENGEFEEAGRWITFSDLPGASFYKPTYRKRGPLRIIGAYGENPDRLLDFSGSPWFVPGEPSFGDVSIGVKLFPGITAMVVLYRGDEEFTPEGNILYRENITNHLPLEDVAVAAGEVASALRC